MEPNRGKWTNEEIEILMNENLTDQQKALMLNRTLEAVKTKGRRIRAARRLRKELDLETVSVKRGPVPGS